MPSPTTKPSAANRPEAHDLDIRLILHRLRDLYVQRQHWQAGKAMAVYITPYQGISPGIGIVEHWIGSSDEAEAHLLSVPLNALIDHYEQLLWLAKIPLPTI